MYRISRALVEELSWLARLPSLLLIGLIRAYQLWISPWIGPQCRFQPTCSEYAAQSIRQRGLLFGGWRAMVRICKCHPWHPGGIDPP